MFRPKTPEEVMKSEYTLNELIAAFTQLSIEEIQKRCDSYPDDLLEIAINSHFDFIKSISDGEELFQFNVGYASREAALKGIHAYAAGTVRQSISDINESIENLQKSSWFSRELNNKVPEKNPLDKKKGEEMLASLEKIARMHLERKNYEERANLNLKLFRSEFLDRKNKNKTPQKKPAF